MFYTIKFQLSFALCKLDTPYIRTNTHKMANKFFDYLIVTHVQLI